MKQKISIGEALKIKCPDLVFGVLECELKNTEFNAQLWEEISAFTQKISAEMEFGSIKQIPNIYANRQAYKRTGKDPNRYRPSAESLMRRIVKGNDLYKVSTLVDVINLVSLKSGYSIGGFDADKIEGEVIAGIGKEGEPYEGIGRGVLNIAGMPVIRDRKGGIGTPTSDEVRTMVSLDTTCFFMNINAYRGTDGLDESLQECRRLLETYCEAININTDIIF